MTTTVIKTIGSGKDYSTMQAWDDASPSNLTTTRSNTTQAGSTSSTIVLDAGASGTNDFYKSLVIWCDARPSEKRLITAYDGTTKVATIGALNGSNATWDTTPGTEAFTIDSVIWRGEAYNTAEYTGSIQIGGVTTGSSNYFELTAADGEWFGDHPDVETNALIYNAALGVAVRNATTYQYALRTIAPASYSRVSRLQLKKAGSVFYNTLRTEAYSCTIKQVIVQSDSGTTPVSLGSQGSYLINSLIIINTSSNVGIGSVVAPDGRIINCTCVRPSDKTDTALWCWQSGGGGSPSQFISNAMFNAGSQSPGEAIQPTSAGGSYTATDASSTGASGTGDLTGLIFADQFENAASDFRVKAGSILIGAGTRQQSYTDDVDIAGRPRSTTAPTIGCWEYIESSAGYDQEGFRWRYDDGDEDGATFSAAQDEHSAASIGVKKRLRALVNVTGTPSVEEFELQYRRVGSPTEDWKKVN